MVGDYEPADIRIAIATALGERRAPFLDGMLFDVSDSAVLAKRTPLEIRSMAAVLAHNRKEYGNRLALVAGSDHAYGMMRLGCADVEAAGVASRCFRVAGDALEWLEGRA